MRMLGDPMVRAYRRRLKMLKIDRGIPVAYSIEKPIHINLLDKGRLHAYPVCMD